MGRAMELISGTVTNPGATITPWTMNSGDSNTVRNFPAASRAWLEDAWCQQATAGYLQVKSPRMHDNLVGIQTFVTPADSAGLYPEQLSQLLYPQDTLTIAQSGG